MSYVRGLLLTPAGPWKEGNWGTPRAFLAGAAALTALSSAGVCPEGAAVAGAAQPSVSFVLSVKLSGAR